MQLKLALLSTAAQLGGNNFRPPRAMKFNLQTLWHRAFSIGVILKGIDGILELAGGIALLVTSRPFIRHTVTFLTHEELIEDPHDFFANLLVHLSQHLSIHSQHFAGIYLLGHGVIKTGLAVGLLRGALWSYPAALIFLAAFIVYQVYRITYSHSIILLLVTVFDLIVLTLVWHEWRRVRKRVAH
jgi:uncharacterized membrane protein